MTLVEFRFLQVVVSHIADERVTIGLLHWDGTKMRVSTSLARVPGGIPSKADLEDTLRTMRNVKKLTDLCPARATETGLLSWSGVRMAHTNSVQQHFERLSLELGLRAD